MYEDRPFNACFPSMECTSLSQMPPPVADRRPHSFSHHGITLTDDYAWLRDSDYPTVSDPDVLAYLNAENAYFEAQMAPHQTLIDTIFNEMKGRQQEDEASVPVKDGAWLYWWAFDKGAQYRKWLRKPHNGGEDSVIEEIIIDESVEAASHEYFRLGAMAVSPDARFVAWAADDDGSERFKLKIREIATGKDIELISTQAIGSIIWSADSTIIFYTEVNENWRSCRAKLHQIGTASADDRLVYEETDPGFSVGLGKSQDRSHIILSTGDHDTSELYLIPADQPHLPPRLISARQKQRQYSVDIAHDHLWIITNDEHVNFRIAKALLDSPEKWETVIAGCDDIYLRGLTSFKDHLVISERIAGLDQIRLHSYQGDEHRISFPETSYTAELGSNPEYAPACYRIGYSSMVTPETVYDYSPASRSLETLKVRAIPSGYDASNYQTERVIIKTRDRNNLPISIVYRKDFPLDGSGNLFLYGYGAYGLAIPPRFSANRLSLLDRGFAYAIAHIRGGDDMGYGWYLDGKLEKRTNTFNDFVDAAKGLIAANYTSPGKIAAQGGSAGGELMGAIANDAPHLWGAIVADVPFVDVLNTMLDETLPLTPGEWPEWGNPILDKKAFDYILSYSPYDNVKSQDYPPMLITGGLNDPRVTYWEPAKWAARLRAHRTDANLQLLKINMGAGHGGKSGRWDSLIEAAEAYSFVLTQMGHQL